jgi:hypothetical protein
VPAEIDVHPQSGIVTESITKVRTQVVCMAIVTGTDEKSFALRNRVALKEASAVKCQSSDLSLRRQGFLNLSDNLVGRTIDLAGAAAFAASWRVWCYSGCVDFLGLSYKPGKGYPVFPLELMPP